LFTARIYEERMRGHHRRMQRVGMTALAACVVVGVVALLISLNLALIAVVASVGVLFAGDMWLRAHRGLKERGHLIVTIRDRHATAEREGGAGARRAGPLLGAQAFPDHIQIVVGDVPTRPQQIELPLDAAERRSLLEYLRTVGGLDVGERRSVGVHLFIALTAVPAGVIVLFLVYRAIVLGAALGVIAGLKALGPEASLAGLAVLAALGCGVLVSRFARR
jgi:hypothetical protein